MAEMDETQDSEEFQEPEDEMLQGEELTEEAAAPPDEFAPENEEITSADHLDQQLEEDAGIEEALQAWAEGGHTAEDFDEADEIYPVQFDQLDADAVAKRAGDTARLDNVMVDVAVELGRKTMNVKELMELKEQDVIELDKLAGEAFTIRINDRPFAEGEIVVVTDIMAVRITRLETPVSTNGGIE